MSQEEARRQVRRAVDATGLSRKDFAEQAGVDLGTLGDFLNGSRWPQARTLVRIEQKLGWPAGRINDLRHETVTEAEPGDLEAAVEADPDLLPEAKRHLLNQIRLLKRIRADLEPVRSAGEQALRAQMRGELGRVDAAMPSDSTEPSVEPEAPRGSGKPRRPRR